MVDGSFGYLQRAEKQELYSKYKGELWSLVSPDTGVDRIKHEFSREIRSRRKLEQITSLSQLILELERSLVIFPEKGSLEALRMILQRLQPVGIDRLLHDLSILSQRLNPSLPTAPPQQQVNLFVPEEIVDLLARTFDKTRGRDWEHFATGLGHGLRCREEVRILQGEVDRIEREHPTTRGRLGRVLQEFQARCRTHDPHLDIIQHIINICRNPATVGNPLNLLAKQITTIKNQR